MFVCNVCGQELIPQERRKPIDIGNNIFMTGPFWVHKDGIHICAAIFAVRVVALRVAAKGTKDLFLSEGLEDIKDMIIGQMAIEEEEDKSPIDMDIVEIGDDK
jgi:hypothetical protein